MIPDQRFLVFLDFDGTIADRGVLLPRPAQAISKAQQRGHVVVLNTGRSFPEVPKPAWDAGFDGHVTSAGAFAKVGREMLHTEVISAPEVERIIQALERRGADFFLQYYDHIFATARMKTLLSQLHRQGLHPAPLAQIAGRLSLEGVARVVFSEGTTGPEQGLMRELRPQLGSGLRFHPGILPGRGVSSGEISAASTNKAVCFGALREHFGIPAERVLAVGDDVNDLEMLKEAGIGVAMGHAKEEVKVAADQTTSKGIRDGVPIAFLRNGLIVA